jgi:competence protein ComEC
VYDRGGNRNVKDSACLRVDFAEFDLATCGDVSGTDAGSRSNVESAAAGSIGNVEVAKVNHHGSTFSSNATYVSTLKAQVSVISVGKNSFGHPAASVISAWDVYGDVYQTQSPTDNTPVDGDVEITTNGATGFVVATSNGGGGVYPLDP